MLVVRRIEARMPWHRGLFFACVMDAGLRRLLQYSLP
jgi:hypothetical protein